MLMITADALNRARRTIVVLPLSTGPEPHPLVVVASPWAGARFVAMCDHLRTADKRRLARNAGRISALDLGAIEDGIRRILELYGGRARDHQPSGRREDQFHGRALPVALPLDLAAELLGEAIHQPAAEPGIGALGIKPLAIVGDRQTKLPEATL